MEKGIPGKWTKKHDGVALPKFGKKKMDFKTNSMRLRNVTWYSLEEQFTKRILQS